jgi:transmembrane sensor
MHFQKFTIEDLILDPAFIKWVKSPIKEDGSLWIEWASLNAENREIIQQAKEIILELSRDEDAPVQHELAELWSRISASNDLFDQRELKKGKGNTIIEFIKSWQRVAAVLTALLFVSVLALLVLNRKIEYQTAYGEHKNIVLPDGSVVVLNANSSISYPSKWDTETAREIWLKGEAFFSVTHKKNSQKFIVHTNDLDVQVLGTKFDVNTRREKTCVILNSGKVKLYLVNQQNKEVDMKPGEMVDFSPKQQRLSKRTVRAEKYSSWVDRKLVFEESSLKEIAALLQDNYGYTVRFSTADLEQLTFTGTIDSDNVDLLFNILQKTFNISIIKKEGGNIVVNKL